MKLGHIIADIQEMYESGDVPEIIAKKTKTSIEFVLDVVKDIQINEAYADHSVE